MPASVRVGQMWCVGAMVVLLSILPWRPASSGVPYARMQETTAVWIACALLIWGMGWARASIGALAGDVAQAKRLKAGLNAASGAMCLTAVAVIVSLSSILATTLRGGGVVPPLPFLESYLYPPQWNYALLAPLLFALACHVAVLVLQVPRVAATPWPATSSVSRALLLVVLALAAGRSFC